jgi:CTP synthase (UTP-ammonia lyase)
MVRVGLIGDYDESVVAHQAIPRALELAGAAVGVDVTAVWMHTASLSSSFGRDVSSCSALWCVPAAPYADTEVALRAIRFARESERPFLGTCGGFQHALLEYAQAKWGMAAPAHAELEPSAPNPVIAPLACALVEQAGSVRFAPGSRMAMAYESEHSDEAYHCRYGLSPRYATRLEGGPLRATGWDDAGDVRSVELDNHPFFVATLFQPERVALKGLVPPIVKALIEVAVETA